MPQMYRSEIWDGVRPAEQDHEAPFKVLPGDRIRNHAFVNTEADNRYVLTAWVKAPNKLQELTDYVAFISIVANNTSLFTQQKRSHIIDGWQRIELTFEFPSSLTPGTAVDIMLHAQPNGIAYFDDIRMHPFDSDMEAYVLDANEQRAVAKLDNRNFATIFQYDEEGNLVRTIQETSRGKQTIEETRSAIRIFE